jgi:hypothetical protein
MRKLDENMRFLYSVIFALRYSPISNSWLPIGYFNQQHMMTLISIDLLLKQEQIYGSQSCFCEHLLDNQIAFISFVVIALQSPKQNKNVAPLSTRFFSFSLSFFFSFVFFLILQIQTFWMHF